MNPCCNVSYRLLISRAHDFTSGLPDQSNVKFEQGSLYLRFHTSLFNLNNNLWLTANYDQHELMNQRYSTVHTAVADSTVTSVKSHSGKQQFLNLQDNRLNEILFKKSGVLDMENGGKITMFQTSASNYRIASITCRCTVPERSPSSSSKTPRVGTLTGLDWAAEIKPSYRKVQDIGIPLSPIQDLSVMQGYALSIERVPPSCERSVLWQRGSQS